MSTDLTDIKNRAEKFIAAHDEMIRIDQGIGGLAVERPDLMPDWDNWYMASDVEHADTVLAVIEATKPRQVTTLRELNSLPSFSVIHIPRLSITLERLSDGWYQAALEITFTAYESWLPATVLHEPEATL